MAGYNHAQMLLRKAKIDLKIMEELVDSSQIEDEGFGFHAQQAIEKALKAWIAWLDEEYPLTHDIGKLLDVLRNLNCKVDKYLEFVDMNPFALEHFHLYKSPAGASMNDIFRQWTELLAFVRADNIAELELPYSYSDRTRWFLVSRSPLYDAFQKPAGMLIICRDITRRKKIEREREQLIDDLQDALANVKTLSGMLPICSNCKKIRDDEGYWNQVEGYIAKHTGAEFTHGICPDCAKKTLDEYFLTKKKRSDYDSSSLIS